MIKTGIYGGSFDPLHNGHISLARQALQKIGLDEVWLIVSPHNPLKKQENLTDDHLRLEMARLALADEPQLVVSDYEFHLPRPSYMWNTLEQIQQDEPQRELYLLIGEDNWENFDQWYRHEDIL
ncbi:MAG: nicotinate (nicotinamide) nucleotide adenylyltransferase, partial [Prevotella sp.]|nr:nicotinate (nicotinamide) nucleotide adenylyltransferase [Prevotella sp.]